MFHGNRGTQFEDHWDRLSDRIVTIPFFQVKITDSWVACHEFEPCNAEDPPCRGGRSTFNLSRIKRPPVGGVWILGEGMPAQVSSSSLDQSSKCRDPSPKALV
ncbi:hypothetical protein TNCV_3919871 [Trichonephila clavipes]|nr:hypothetical protein TNCV_3919871 [Trichonephila clavipes]